MNAAWFQNDGSRSHGADGQWSAVPHADYTILLVHALPPDDFELGYREALARPNPDWHWRQAQQFEKDQAWFSVAFHCKHVLKSRSDDAAAKQLLDTARERLKKP